MILYNVFCDAAERWQIGLQDPATPMVEGMQFFHNYLVFFSIIIAIFVCFLLFVVIFSFNHTKQLKAEKFTHSSLLEIIWTIIPAFILFLIAIPSFSLLYSLDELISPTFVVKVIGHQWYWSYEYSDLLNTGKEFGYDSYMTNLEDLTFGAFRLLEVDNRLVLPVWVHIRLLITSADVLHSWAVPSFGIKVDACPGRLSQASLLLKRTGVYYGQCSEICGVNHGFMPIVVRVLDRDTFLKWFVLRVQTA
jgi:cytochrome c oxidase subunit 2